MTLYCLDVPYEVTKKRPQELQLNVTQHCNEKAFNFHLDLKPNNISNYSILKLNIGDYFYKLNNTINDGIKHIESRQTSSSPLAKDIEENMNIATSLNPVFPFFRAICNFNSVDEILDLNDNSLAYVMHLIGFKTILVLISNDDLTNLIRKEELALDLSYVRVDSL